MSNSLMFIYYAMLACFAIGPWVWVLILKAKTNKKEASEKNAESPRTDLPATRQWVEQQLNAKTANCMRIDGQGHKDIKEELREYRAAAPSYYLFTATANSGRQIGRLFTGRNCGLALCSPVAWEKNHPLPLTDEELTEYATWTGQAEWEYTCNSNHTSSEDWGTEPRRTDLYAHTGVAAIAALERMGVFIWH